MVVGKEWLDYHLETFVRPVLGLIPDINPKQSDVMTFNPTKLGYLLELWRAAQLKAKDRMILLPGRDVWLFEVIARLEGFSTIFKPELSSSVSQWYKGDLKECFCVDTGYSGSVPRKLKIPNFALVSYSPYPRSPENVLAHQLLPDGHKAVVSSLSGYLEGCSKYWTRAEPYYISPKSIQPIIENGEVKFKQTFSDPATFIKATILTMHVAQNIKYKRRIIMPKSLGRTI